MTVSILQGDALAVLRTLPSEHFHCVVTSPPYFGLRSYLPNGHEDKALEIGSEKTPDAWCARLVEVFREVRRVLRSDGVCFVNIGDSYCNFRSQMGPGQAVHGRDKLHGKPAPLDRRRGVPGLKEKDLIGAPWMLAFALRADGWWLRGDYVWDKPNPMPESVRDRCTKAHEMVFHLTKSGESTFWVHRDKQGTRTRPAPDYRWVHKTTGEEVAEDPGDPENWKRINLWSGRDYFWDAEAVREPVDLDYLRARWGGSLDRTEPNGAGDTISRSLPTGKSRALGVNSAGRNLRSVWTIATEPLPSIIVDGEKLDHFASYPVALARRCILAGTSAKGCCPECGAPWARVVERTTTGWRPTCSCFGWDYVEGIAVAKCEMPPIPCRVLDPFGGSGKTALAAEELGRDCTLIELNPKSCAMAKAQLEYAKARRMIGDVAERVPVGDGQLALFGAAAAPQRRAGDAG